MDRPVLTVNNVAKSFGGVTAVADVSFSISPGERVALIGPNGAGKTTLINLISGLLPADQGQVALAGSDISKLSAQARCQAGLGRTFQIASAFSQLDLGSNIALAIAQRQSKASWNPLAGLPKTAIDQAERMMALVGLKRLPNTQVSALSYGEVKRLELAIALASNPTMFLLDEPMAGVGSDGDTNLVATASEALLNDGTEGEALLFTEHDMDVVFGQATRILVLDQGQLIADGQPDEIATDAKVQAVYLGEEVSA